MTRAIHHSYWLQQRPLEARFEPLANKVKTDVLVVGGGITGLTTALELAKRGKRVVICEASFISLAPPQAALGTWMLIQKLDHRN